MGAKDEGSQPVDLYFLSMHLGVALEIDALLELQINEHVAWTGNVTGNATIDIDKPDFYGGPRREGGVVGKVDVMLGGPSQVLSADNAYRLNDGTPENRPGFRGITTLFFRGEADPRTPIVEDPKRGKNKLSYIQSGFYWAANLPYLKPVWAKVRRAPKGLTESPALDANGDANGAHILYEVCKNPNFGMNAGAGLDVDAYELAGQQCADEGLFFSMLWVEQSTIDEFVQDVLTHVDGLVFPHPRTGLLTLKLIRDDYDVESLPVINPDNAILTNFQRKGWAETVNEIVAQWTNPKNEQSSAVTIQDIANIAMQGTVVSNSKNFYGARTADLAMKLAARCLRQEASPFCSVDVEPLRSAAWDFAPGDVFKLQWPEHGIDNVVMRIFPIDYGDADNPRMRFSAVEDVFGLAFADYSTPPDTEWEDPNEIPQPMSFVKIITLPWYSVEAILGNTAAEQLQDGEVLLGWLASQPGRDTRSYDLYVKQPILVGGEDYRLKGTKSLVGHGVLANDLAAEVFSAAQAYEELVSFGPEEGAIIILGNLEGTMEAILNEGSDASPQLPYRRGVLDTVPRAWPAGTDVWFLNPGMTVHSTTAFAAGETVESKLLTNTSLGQLALDDAPVESEVASNRPHLPIRPAGLSVDGDFFRRVDAGAGPFLVEWAIRNRFMEAMPLLSWEEAGVAAEDGQTTTIVVMDPDRNVLATYPDLAIESQSVLRSVFLNAHIDGIIQATAYRDGQASLQSPEVVLKDILLDETVALLDEMAVPPTAERQSLINQLIYDLKTAGVWDKLDALWLMAAHDQQAASLNWKDPTGVSLVYVNEPVTPFWEADVGFTGDWTNGEAPGHIDTGHVVGAGNYQQDDAHVGFFLYQLGTPFEGVEYFAQIGADDFDGTPRLYTTMALGAQGDLLPATNINSDDGDQVEISDPPLAPGTGQILADVWGVGTTSERYYLMSRTSAAEYVLYRDGINLGVVANVSAGLPVSSFSLFRAKLVGSIPLVGGYLGSMSTMSAAHLGGGLTEEEASDLREAILAYLVGAGVV